ncbi:MAG: bifunctional phosphopantothenoylcysteine decarboxylase/phosphopantothenate--cysteine ligase CoaBC [Rickettsiales bacterium]
MALPRSVLLIITGSVASYKALELIRLLRAEDISVTAILTRGGAKFITPLAVSSLTGSKTYDDLWSLTDEVEMGHIELSRVADVVLIAPASADILAKMAAGIADDLATTALLATNKPVIVAPAMNHKMWSHPATQRNVAQLRADGISVIEPTEGAMACGEFGVGRMAEPGAIVEYLSRHSSESWNPSSAHVKWIPAFAGMTKPLEGKIAIVTSGPTIEAIDPVRYLGNRSSGKQGHAIAAALVAAGARVTLIHGDTHLPTPPGVTAIRTTTADAMLAAVEAALPADIFVGAAAVADWRPAHTAPQKLKKQNALDTLTLEFVPTVDVLATIAQHTLRPTLVVGFAAETENLAENARAKRARKQCDWLLANVATGAVFGADDNEILFLNDAGEEHWPRMRKQAVAAQLVTKISDYFSAPARMNPAKKGKTA